MRLFLFGFILLLMPLMVLGHDLYHAYGPGFPEIEEIPYLEKPSSFSDLGWLWVQYSPETYNMARNSIDPTIWEEKVSPALRQNAMFMTSLPALFYFTVLFFLKLMGLFPFAGAGLLINRTPKVKTGPNIKRGMIRSGYTYKRK